MTAERLSAAPGSSFSELNLRTPFQKGNSEHLQSGGRSPRVYGALAEQLAAGLMEDRPDLATYPEAVAGWATAEAKAVLFRRHLEQVGPFADDGQPRKSLLQWAHQSETAAAKHRAVLGLDPRSEAALIRERASATALGVDLAVLAERGRAVLDAREAAGIDPPPDVAGEVLAQVQLEGAQAMAAAAARDGNPPPRNTITLTDHDDNDDDDDEATT